MVVMNNVFKDDGVYIEESSVEDYLSYAFEDNTVNGLSLGYFENLTKTEINTPHGQLILINCSQVSIRDQNCSNAGGIIIRYCPKIQIINSACMHNPGYGIDITDSPHAYVADNLCVDNDGRAIQLVRSQNATIYNNTCLSTIGVALYLYESNNSIIANNTIIDNTYFGIHLFKCNSSTVINNTIVDNGEDGLQIAYSANCSIHYNLFMKNYYYGVELIGTTNCVISHNTFVDNDEAYGHVNPQGADDGNQNTWYDPSSLEGNYWFDYSGTGSYQIDGSGLFDPFPLQSPPVPFLNAPPYFTLIPVDATFTRGTGQVTWSATDPDNNLASYIVYRNDNVYQEGEWPLNGIISIDLSGFSVRRYNLTIVIQDSYSLQAKDTVWVTIYAIPERPRISSPPDITYTEGETGHKIVWELTDPDNNPATFTIYRNGNEFSTNTWMDGVKIELNVDGLTVGTYNYTIIAFDEDSQFFTDTVWVTVTPRESDTLTSEERESPSISPGYLMGISVVALSIILAIKRKKH
jgi:parallel beta-helix repeat protein